MEENDGKYNAKAAGSRAEFSGSLLKS